MTEHWLEGIQYNCIQWFSGAYVNLTQTNAALFTPNTPYLQIHPKVHIRPWVSYLQRVPIV